MILKAIIDNQEYSLNVPQMLIEQGDDFFAKLDADMDKGWQMSREWIQHPDRHQRCQIVADKLLTALENENERLGMLMAGYILRRMPEVDTVEIDIGGEIQNTQFNNSGTELSPERPEYGTVSEGPPTDKISRTKLEAMETAGNQVTKVFKVGKAYRFSVFDQAAESWQDSPLIATQQEAERLRQEVFKKRFETLLHEN